MSENNEGLIAEKSIFTIESFAGDDDDTKSIPLIKMIQSRGNGTGGRVYIPKNGDSLGGIEYVAAKGQSNGTSALTAAKIDVKFRLDTNTNRQKNTADIFFTTSEWLTVNGTPKHSLTTRLSVLGDGKVGVNTSNPLTNFFVQGSTGTSTNTETVNSSSNISVLGKSTIFISVNSGPQTITLNDGVVGQRIVIINTSNSNSLTISNGAKSIIIAANEGKELICNGTNWYALS